MMRRSLVTAGVALLAGCKGIINGTCTLIGCNSGLIVALAQAPTSAYRIEVFSTPDGPHYVFDCPNPAQCVPEAMFDDYMPASVTIRVTTSAGTREQTAQPAYSVSRPNGPNCEPECRQARVTVALPG
jgi:hypothetical protein